MIHEQERESMRTSLSLSYTRDEIMSWNDETLKYFYEMWERETYEEVEDE